MPSLLFLVRPIDKGGEDLDQHVVAAEAKGCCLRPYARGGAFEFVREDGAVGRGGGLRRFDKNIDGGAVERGQPARLHEHTLPIDDVRVEQGQRSSIGHGFEVPGEQCSNFEKGRHSSFAVGRKPAPRRKDYDDGFAVGAADAGKLDRQVFGFEAAMSAQRRSTALASAKG